MDAVMDNDIAKRQALFFAKYLLTASDHKISKAESKTARKVFNFYLDWMDLVKDGKKVKEGQPIELPVSQIN